MTYQAYLVAVVLLTAFGVVNGSWRPKGEFVAGSFILTQKSLDEAPYRYAGVLRQALDIAEAKDPPTQSDEAECSAKYRIEPSGRRSRLNIIDDTLSMQLQENNTLIISAQLYAEVAAKTWIWKGINFGLLGCLKMTSCNGEIVTYSAYIDMELSIQVLWDSNQMSIKIKPVQTTLHDVNVAGCRPPWFLFWFKGWQNLLNEGVQEGFQEFANKYEKQKEIPEEFSPFKGVFVHYLITNLQWSSQFVMLDAKAIFSAEISGSNVTFIPLKEKIEEQAQIPSGNWPMISKDDTQSHLLQGVRLSTEFINSLMWFASLSNLTKYHGSARILDTTINGTISYEPPVIRVQEDNLLTINIGKGLLLAECLPIGDVQKKAAILFKAEFSDLAGSGKIRLASTIDKTGIKVSLDQLDLSRMKTLPFEPKLPLPEAFESQLMKSAIAQLQPVVNQYLTEKPLFLPENIAPLAAAPVINLWSTGNGSGYAEVLSYCTCDEETNTPFALCDSRSNICSPEKKIKQLQQGKKNITVAMTGLKAKLKQGLAFATSLAESTLQLQQSEPNFSRFNFSQYVVNQRNGNLSYVGFHFTIFDDSSDCLLDQFGAKARAFWLWQTFTCTPIFLSGKWTKEYYYLAEGKLSLFCEDDKCQNCRVSLANFDRRNQEDCFATSTGASYRVGKPLVYSWQTRNVSMSYVANVFFSENFCAYYPTYIEPQVLSSHINLGFGNDSFRSCLQPQNTSGVAIDFKMANESMIARAYWDCKSESCFGCFFRVSNAVLETCTDHEEKIKIAFTQTIPEFKPFESRSNFVGMSEENMIFLGVGSAILLVSLVVIVVLVVWKKKLLNGKLQRPSECGAPLKSWVADNVGIRFKTWSTSDQKTIREDVVQNVMVLTNGILAIVFAVNWNSDNNPLLVIHNKFQSGFTISLDIFTTNQVEEFADNLNFYTFLVNIANACVAFVIVVVWCFTKTGHKSFWMKLRLASCASMLASIFVVLAACIFTAYFDHLVILKRDEGYFVTDNEAMHDFASQVMKVSLNGLSLTVVSFTIVFLFHGVGGGLFCGTVLFRLSHLASKTQNMEVLTTLLVILTIIQPFICLHPVIIWSQDSQHNSTFLILIILIWFLPLGIHIVMKTLLNQGLQRCSPVSIIQENEEIMFHRPKKVSKIQPKIDSGMKKKSNKNSSDDGVDPRVQVPKANCSQRRQIFLKCLDIFVQIMQLTFFLGTFTIITHHIINTEFSSENSNLQNFVLPAIISVFVWMASISYLLLSLVLDESRKTSPLVFKDQNLEEARDKLRSSLRRRLNAMDRNSFRARSLNRRSMLEAAEAMKKGKTLPASQKYEPNFLNSSIRSNLGSGSFVPDQEPANIELMERVKVSSATSQEDQSDVQEEKDKSWWGKTKRLWHFLVETLEYKEPQVYGWRIKFRRIFLMLGTLAFTYQTIHTAISTQNYSSKREIQEILDYLGTNLTWPESGSMLDQVFLLYNNMEATKAYLMMVASLLFWLGLILDVSSHHAKRVNVKALLFSGSRVANFFGSLTVFASVIVVGLPDYLAASNLDTICPFCGYDFNHTVRQVAEFSIGLFFACLFTFQLIPILVTIAPALVRASVLILIHPALQVQEGEVSNLRMTILQQVIQFSSVLTFPITFISMAILQQYQKDIYVTLLIVAFWTMPPALLYLGLHYSKKYRRYTILLFVYYLYNCAYVGLLCALLFYSLTLQRVLEVLEKLLQQTTFWTSSIAQVFLCNVVISDMLYMTVFQ